VKKVSHSYNCRAKQMI